MLDDRDLPYGDDVPEPPPELDRLARLAIGAAIAVHRELGPGLPEECYQRAMEFELADRGIPFETQKVIDVVFKGRWVGRAKLDLLVGGRLVVELKSVEMFVPVNFGQVRTYLRLVGEPLGLLINFNVSLVKDGVRRVVRS